MKMDALPLELWNIILNFLDNRSLLRFRRVCSTWNDLIENIIRKRTFKTLRLRQKYQKVNIAHCFVINKIFHYNVLKNTRFTIAELYKDSQDYTFVKSFLAYWKTAYEWKADWAIECPPIGTLGEIPSHFLKSNEIGCMGQLPCIANDCRKGNCQYQDVKIADLGLSDEIMDQIQPKIIVDEWIGVRFDCGVQCSVKVEIFNEGYRLLASKSVALTIPFGTTSQWRRVSFCLKGYGEGARIIRFSHTGRDRQYLAGCYGSKFALPSVTFALDE